MTFEGFTAPTKNYFHMPNNWTDITAEIDNLAELKVVEYVLRHTWGYKEYAVSKVISVDEFMKGRRRADGSRMDKGTGLKSDRSVKDALKLAVQHGYLICEVDLSDLGRTKKSYGLNMLDTGVVSTPPVEVTPVVSTPQTPISYPSEVQHLPPRGTTSTPRSEKETDRKIPLKETEKERTPNPSNNPQAITLTEDEQQVFDWYCQLWFIGKPPRLTADRKQHCAVLARKVKSQEDMNELEQVARDDLKQKGIKVKSIELGNMVNSLSNWLALKGPKTPLAFPQKQYKPGEYIPVHDPEAAKRQADEEFERHMLKKYGENWKEVMSA